MTSRNFVVTVKETGDGGPWLLVEPDEDIGLGHGASIAMDLPNGSDIQEAQRVAKLLNESLAGFRVSRI